MEKHISFSAADSNSEPAFSDDEDYKETLMQTMDQVVTELGFTEGKAYKTKVRDLVGKRKCRGIFCLLFFFVILGALVYLNATQDYNASYQKATLFATSTDGQRRICGMQEQVDARSPDYSDSVNSTESMMSFCYLMTGVFADRPDFAAFDCSSELREFTYRETSRFLKLMADAYSSMGEYDIGYNSGSLTCVSRRYLNQRDSAQDKCAPLKDKAGFVADREMLDVLPYLVRLVREYAAIESCGEPDSQLCESKRIAQLLLPQLSNFDSDNQFFTQVEMQLVKDVIQQLFPQHKYILDFFHQTQAEDLKDFVIYYDPKSFGSGIIPTQCVTNYYRAVKSQAISVNYVVTIAQYYYNAFQKPVPTAIYEFDMQLQNAGISIAFSFALTIVFQLFMYVFCQGAMYTALFGVDAFLLYLSSQCIIYAHQMIITSDDYYKEFRVYNFSYQFYATLFIGLSVIIIIFSVLVSFAALLLLSLVNVLARLVRIARKSLRKAWQIMVIPLVTLAISCAWIFMHIILIFLNIAKYGEFDAKYNTFVAAGPLKDYLAYYLLLVLLIISMLFGIFLQLSILQFLAGSIVTYYYFLEKDKNNKVRFTRSLRHMFLHFGDLVQHAFYSTFLVWFRFVFEFISNKFVYLPEQKALRKMVRFSRQYVSLCSKYTLFQMALCGLSYKDARKQYIGLMGKSLNKVSSIKSIISVFFLFSKVLIPIMSWALFKILKNYANERYESVILVWINIFSMGYGYLNASMALNLTQYILDVICHCYVVELAENGGAVYSVPYEFALFVQTYID